MASRTGSMWAVYIITCTPTGAYYIGRTGTRPAKRWVAHLSALRRFRSSRALQAAWEVHGEASFTFQVLRDGMTAADAKRLERHLIERLQPVLNTIDGIRGRKRGPNEGTWKRRHPPERARIYTGRSWKPAR